MSGTVSMTNLSKNLIVGSMIASGLVVLAAVLDLATQFPFGRNVVMDVLFLVSAAVVIYMAWDSYREIT